MDKIINNIYDWKQPYQSITSDIFLTKEFSEDTKLTAQFNGSYGAGLYSYRNIDDAELENNVNQAYLYGQANFYHTFNAKFSLSAAANLVVDKFSGTEIQYKNDKLATQNIWNHNKITLQYRSKRIINRTGVEFVVSSYDETYSFNADYEHNVQNNFVSIYNDTKLYTAKNLTASIGLRSEYSLYLKTFNLAPRLYLAYKLNPENIFSVAAGDYFQLPLLDYLKISDNLDFVSVRKATASYGYVSKLSKFQIDTYYKKYRNIVACRQGQFIDNSGKGYGWGADVFWKSNFKTLEYWLTYSYNDTKKQYDDFSESVAPPDISRHVFNVTLKYWIAPLQSLVGASYNISSGAPYYNDEFPRIRLGTTPFRSRLDMSWSFLPKPWIVIHFGCQNVFDKNNIYGYEYSKHNPGKRRAITATYSRFFIVGVFITFSSSKTLNQLKDL
jgi:hypothetical protein